MTSNAEDDDGGSARAAGPLGALVAMAVLLQPLIASSTVSRGIDPPKSLALACVVFLFAGWALWRGFLFGSLRRQTEGGSRDRTMAIGLALSGFAALIAALAAAPDFWTSLLGTFARRQGFITETTELAVFLAAAGAVASGVATARGIIRMAVLAAGTVAASAVCQSHWVGFLDPTTWNAENFNRVSGSMGSAPQLCTYLALATPLTLGLAAAAARECDRRGLFAYLTILGLEAVAMIYARGKVGILGAVAGATLFCVMMVPLSSAGRVVRTTLLALFGLLIAFLILLNLPGKPLHSLTTGDTALRHVAEHMSRLTDFGEGSGRVRVLLGEATRDALESRPAAWVLGVGPDGAWGALAPFDRPERETIEGQGTAQDRPHQFLYEKLLSGGLLYCAAWLGLLALGVGAACRRLGYFKSSGTAALAIAAGAAAGFVFCIIATGSLALAGGASLLAACGAAGILLCVRRFRLRDADLATAGDPVWIGIVCALCAHFAAGSFSVSMAPERTLAFALAAAALFAASHGKGRNSGASGDAPDRDGLLLGAAALATLPLYVYYGFRWEQAPRPVYAAAIVPVYLLFSALLSFRAQWKRRLVEAAVVYLLGFAIFGLCRWLEWWQMGLARDS
jgi:hypothetical protein